MYLEELRRLTGNPKADFRQHQLEAIQALIGDRLRVLCVQRTGWGKSAVYFIATAILREQGAGPTVLISPLLALMRNQVAACDRLGLKARTVNSSNQEEWDTIFFEIETNAVDVVLISPERLNNPQFRERVAPDLLPHIGLLVVDEAHCISDWGHDFRPDYRRIASVVEELTPGTPILCTTATANDRVVADIETQLSSPDTELKTFHGSLDRPSLRLEVVDLPSAAERLAWLATHLPSLRGSGIVYCLTVRDTELVASWLGKQGMRVEAYSGQSEAEQRPEIEARLAGNELKAVVATSALGMGYDKPDLGFVVHYQAPASPIAYYQQVGRAGRQLAEAHGVLLRGEEDREIQDFFIDVAFPEREHVEEVLTVLGEADGALAPPAIEAEVNVRHRRLENMLKVLEVEGAVSRGRGGWTLTGAPWSYDSNRVASVTRARRNEQDLMSRYGDGDQCLMQFLREALDEPASVPCGRCAACTSPLFDGNLADELVREALEHIRGRSIVLPPRKQWAGRRGRAAIPPELRAEVGRALSEYNDPGWGKLVARGKWKDERFDDQLVDACVALIADWDPDPPPEWVTAVPSLKRPLLVADFANRFADQLGLPFVEVLTKRRPTPPQKAMENSAQQADNISGALLVGPDVRPDPVLLIDDITDSGWTMTEAATCLRAAGSGPVYPLALALAGGKR